MEKTYLKYIRKFLDETSGMIPSPTQMMPKFSPDPSIKAVVFDVYGTLMISASGDIDESVISAEILKTALDAAGIVLEKSIPDPQLILMNMLESFKVSITAFHEKERNPDKPYPEVDILDIWESIIISHRDQHLLKLNGPLCIKCFTFVFEVLSNNIYPMPGMKEVILQLSGKGLPLGIISNAQFYTPLILNYYIHDTVSDNEYVEPFDKSLTVFSYQHLRSKPDGYLFELIKTACSQRFNISPAQILFVGNDMFRDVYPAHNAGFKTALFAGDSRSLRLRKDRPELAHLHPDHIITELSQLLKIIV